MNAEMQEKFEKMVEEIKNDVRKKSGDTYSEKELDSVCRKFVSHFLVCKDCQAKINRGENGI